MKEEIIGGLVLCSMGLGLFFVSPVWLWTLTEKWKTKDGTGPSKSYAILLKALGLVFAAAGCTLMIWGG